MHLIADVHITSYSIRLSLKRFQGFGVGMVFAYY